MDLTPQRLRALARSEHGKKLLRYGSVSIISTIGTLSLLFLTYHVFSVGTAMECNVLATGVMTIPAYYLNRTWTWGKSGPSHLWREVVPFWVIAAISLLISTVVVGFAAHNADHVTHSKLYKALLIVCANFVTYACIWIGRYLLYNHVLFKSHHRPALAGADDLAAEPVGAAEIARLEGGDDDVLLGRST
jgi:putative flippase GtrA